MKRTYHFVVSTETITCVLPSGQEVTLPVIPGLLKHPAPGRLAGMLRNPAVARKYTITALRKASWPILRQFPRQWLKDRLEEAHLKPSRHRALVFLLS